MPPITEAKLYEAFGLTPPEGQGAQVQEPAEPAAEPSAVETIEGAQEQEPAEPAQIDNTEPGTDNDPEPAADDGAEPGGGERKPPQTAEERRANAARRRQQEQQAAVDQAVADALKAEREQQAQTLTDLFARAGLKNTITGEPIKSMEDFQNWEQQFRSAQLEADLKKGKLTPEGLATAIGNHPIVQQAQQLVEQQKTTAQQEQAAADQARIDDQLAKIREMNPEIKGLGDILAMPTGGEFRKYVAKGYDFLDSFRLANMDAMAEAKAQRAKEAAQSVARSKEHLVATGNSRGAGAASVPPSQMTMFRRMNPGASDADIQKFYNNYLKRQGG